jgi:RNA polymerase sigma-70 factor (ECF subfamily)
MGVERAGAPEPGADHGALADAVRRFQQGRDRHAAFREIHDRFFHPLQRFFARRGLSPDDALDLTQDTFLRVYKGLDGYEDRERFAAWLFRIATTTHLKWLRRRRTAKRDAVEVPHDAVDGSAAPPGAMAVGGRQLDGLLEDEQRRLLYAAVARLPDQMRHCLTLRLVHHLSYEEIATVKKLSLEAVKAHLFRARKTLRETVQGNAERQGS